MKISYHIFNLLQEHDCVIVPNFGAFVARNISAKISRDGSRIYPPNKEIVSFPRWQPLKPTRRKSCKKH